MRWPTTAPEISPSCTSLPATSSRALKSALRSSPRAGYRLRFGDVMIYEKLNSDIPTTTSCCRRTRIRSSAGTVLKKNRPARCRAAFCETWLLLRDDDGVDHVDHAVRSYDVGHRDFGVVHHDCAILFGHGQ